jgi:hypothetical protein
MIGDVIYSLLSNDASVSALVSTRIYPSLAIENVVYPYIVYENTANEPTNDKDGKSTLDTLTYNIEIYTETLSESNTLGINVRNVLDRYAGTVSGKVVQSVKYVNENAGYSDNDRVHLKMQSYDFRYYTIYSSLSKVTDLAGVKVSNSEIALSWSNVATGNAGYEVWRSIDSINWSLIATTATNAVAYNNTGLTSATAYIYKIRATDGTDGGEWSNIVSVATDGSTTASGIAYMLPISTGQYTSYVTNDDGWNYANNVYDYTMPTNPVSVAQLDTTHATPFLKLVANNSFGNKDRFTDDAGGQTYANDYVIDHLTRLGWYRVLNSFTRADWSTSIISATASTAVSFSDWRIPNLEELSTISQKFVNVSFNYAPFNLTMNAWASTTRIASTTQAYYIQGTPSLNGVLAKTTLRDNVICRNHF